MNDPRSRTLITVDELVRLLDARGPVVLLDVIDEQGAAPEGRPKIPGASSVHLATDFSGKPTPGSGKRPLPDIRELESKVRSWGISRDTPVVVYDNSSGAQASRLVDSAMGRTSECPGAGWRLSSVDCGQSAAIE